ncbi:extracellular solute-binding protein [Thalassobacillus pellis]|uniref:extracellular solute-binding protein n=1 Tax=Thalassobacillus pellis TaxID=748008 RepID=UPI00196088A7|nr:extracellular solute-binding protein [Thalassobacillus pellis]MBM7551558.1 putative aldouronate transport system substrate-binding protein [Thalassobacillus pellis]
MRKNYLFLLMIAILSLGMMTGCMMEKPSDAESQDDGESKDGVVEITTVRTMKDDTKFKKGEDVNNNVVTRWAEEDLGINFNTLWTVPSDEQYNTKIRLSMSAGKDLPDVFLVSDGQLIADLIESGKVMQVDEAIEKHASPRLKKIFKKFPEAFYQATVDGKRYGIPRFSGGNGSDSLLWIRQDWLDKFNLEAPKTIKELEHVMEVFSTQDPDGNGKDDTMGITLASKNGLATWLADGSFIFGAEGDYLPKLWSENEKGELVYGSIQPNAKDALARLNEWYEKGYLDKEIGILDEQAAIEDFVAGKSGIIAAPPWADGWPINDAEKNIEGANVQPYPLPGSEDGQIGRKGEGLTTGQFLFSKDFEHMDKFFEYWDAIYGYTLGDSKYFEKGMFEGYDYVMQDGKPVYDQETIEKVTGEPYINPGKYFLPTDVPTIPYMLYDLLEDLHATGRDAKNPYEARFVGGTEEYLEAGAIVNQQNEIRIENKWTGPPTKTMQERGELLEKMEQEYYADIIYGNLPVDAFDEFVEKWKSSGGDKITEEVNAWYDSVQGK